ncbi:fumarylacetoacetate hydrolase family protein [Candidatus Entotheonella palauensis]|uniref:fumarylacetoacetate hydrolase family protein n=1 Tax=Candidatus Entotheonella palauensis TaxID=93172 RepID=UPI000B7F9843|nr:fumarylacetoacetate hydrolase family protein [Candidatus Entotheonella palauensis]
MKWCRFQIEQRVRYGVVEDDRVTEVTGSPLADYTVTDRQHLLSEVKLLPPIVPPMLYAAGPNYRGHVEGMAKRRGAEPTYPERPEPNFRSVHALIGTEENIVVPRDCSGAVQPEGQLAVVIGKRARRVAKEEALDYVFGYSIGNDISQRVWQANDRTMFRGKNCDTFKPFGPWIVTGLEPTQFRIIVRHNGSVWQDFSSADQIWDTAAWIQELSGYTTLHPGDVLWMGTEGADGDMVPGDVIEVEISGIGILRNRVVPED